MKDPEETRRRNAEKSRRWRAANPERNREIARRSRDTHREENRAKCRAYYWRTREQQLGKARAYRTAAKAAVFEAYGGPACKCCGETIEKFLTIDHINGGGRAHRSDGRRIGSEIYIQLKARGFPPGFQVLCFNCNCGRSVNGGTCPHA